MSYPHAAGAVASPRARDAIRVAFGSPGGNGARAARLFNTVLTPSGWVKLIARLGEIPDPTVVRAPSPASIRVNAAGPRASEGRESRGNH